MNVSRISLLCFEVFGKWQQNYYYFYFELQKGLSTTRLYLDMRSQNCHAKGSDERPTITPSAWRGIYKLRWQARGERVILFSKNLENLTVFISSTTINLRTPFCEGRISPPPQKKIKIGDKICPFGTLHKLSTKDEGGQNTKNPVNIIYGCPLVAAFSAKLGPTNYFGTTSGAFEKWVEINQH